VRSSRPLSRAFGLALVLAFAAGCASLEGARLYEQGSDALEAGETELAITKLEEATVLVPHASEIQNHLGIAYAEDGQHERALWAFRRAVELDCDNVAAQQNLDLAEERQSQLAVGAGSPRAVDPPGGNP